MPLLAREVVFIFAPVHDDEVVAESVHLAKWNMLVCVHAWPYMVKRACFASPIDVKH